MIKHNLRAPCKKLYRHYLVLIGNEESVELLEERGSSFLLSLSQLALDLANIFQIQVLLLKGFGLRSV